MFEQLLRKVGHVVSRSNMLGNLVSACARVILAILGPDHPSARYIVQGCCDLRSVIYCVGEDPVKWGCAGTWCLTCGTFRTTGPCEIFHCYECYSSVVTVDVNRKAERAVAFDDVSKDIICSKAINTHQPCNENSAAESRYSGPRA